MRQALVSLLVWLVCASAQAQAVMQNVQVAMPDGITLSTDVWTPLLDNTKRPVLLRRTPYGRAVDATTANNLVAQGYVLVSQDVRGRGNSQGEFLPFFDDKIDGKATIDWIAAQAWSNARVGTYSASAEGIVQYMAMASAPEALRCAHVSVPTHDLYEGMFPGGVWRTDLGTQWLTGLGATDVIAQWKSHEVRDGYWDRATLTKKEMAKVDHPVFIVGGMFDIFAASQVRTLTELQASVAPASRNDVFLVLGPWTHGGISTKRQGELLYPDDAIYVDNVPDFLEYTSWCLKDGVRPDFPALRYYVTELTDDTSVDTSDGKTVIHALGAWKEAETWPPAGVHDVTMFLQADDVLHGNAPTSAKSIELMIDPSDPTPSLGGGNLTSAAGPYDQAAIDLREDVYVTQTAAVSEAVEVVGNLRAKLWIASATTDLDVIVRVEALTPAGKAVAFADGALRGRFARGLDRARALTPGEPTPFDVELGPVALRLGKGHALRIAISSVSAPRYEPNPNVADALATAKAPVATTLTLFRDDAHPSRILIPVAAGELPGTVEMPDAGSEQDAGEVTDGAIVGSAGTVASTLDSGAAEGGAGMSAPSTTKPEASGCGCHVLRGGRRDLPFGVFGVLLVMLAFRARRRMSHECAGSRSRRRAA